MLHSIGFVSGDPTIRISYPFVYHPGIKVTVSEPGKSKWIYMSLPLCKGDLITEVKIAYRNFGILSFASMLRIIEQNEPVSATVLHNEELNRDAVGFTLFSSKCNVVVRNSLILKLCMEFADVCDTIEIGSVEIEFVPEYAAIKEEEHDTQQAYRFASKDKTRQKHGWRISDLFVHRL